MYAYKEELRTTDTDRVSHILRCITRLFIKVSNRR